MIKYVEIKGYQNLGEIMPHVYQWIEIESDLPSVILVSAYDGPAIVFKGKVLLNTLEYKPEKINDDELFELERLVGPLGKVRNFNIFNALTEVAPDVIFEEVKK